MLQLRPPADPVHPAPRFHQNWILDPLQDALLIVAAPLAMLLLAVATFLARFSRTNFSRANSWHPSCSNSSANHSSVTLNPWRHPMPTLLRACVGAAPILDAFVDHRVVCSLRFPILRYNIDGFT
jgi:hypothetical protein